MAKNDNLTDFLKDIADVIRDRTGTSDVINPQDFSSKIQQFNTVNINSGVGKKAINFYDYDGTLLYSYTKEEFNNLTNLPPIPQHDNMKDEEWNWTFDDIIAILDNIEILDVGVNCITNDGKTRLYLKLYCNTKVLLKFQIIDVREDTTFIIDWGDGEAQTITYSTICDPDYELCIVSDFVKINHIYNSSGDYCINITPLDNTIKLGDSINDSGFSNIQDAFYKIELGEKIILSEEALQYITCQSINVPKSLPFSAINRIDYLKFISIPKGVTVVPNFSNSRIEIISLPNTIINTHNSNFENNPILQNIYLSNVTNSDKMFQACINLKTIHLPSTYNIGASMFVNCGLQKLIIPNEVINLPKSVLINSDIKYIKIFSNTKGTGSSLSGLKLLSVCDLIDATPSNLQNEFYNINEEALLLIKSELWDEWFNNVYPDARYCLTTDVYPKETKSIEIFPELMYLTYKDTSVNVIINGVVDGNKISTGDNVENYDYKRYVKLDSISTENTSALEKAITLEYELNGQIATANVIQAGVGIQHIDGTLYSLNDWTNNAFDSDLANGVCLSIGENSFVISKNSFENYKWGGYGTDILTEDSVGKGKDNTDLIISTLDENNGEEYAAKIAKSYIFPNGNVGFLPSKNEIELIINNKDKIAEAFNLLGIDFLVAQEYWLSSSQSSINYVYCMNVQYYGTIKLTTISKNTPCKIRPISYL